MSRIPSGLAACAGIALAQLVACGSSSSRGAAVSSSEALDSSLSLKKGIALSADPAGVGQTVTATATYTNQGSSPVTIGAIALAARPPGGTHAGGPYDDFQPFAPQTTLQPGASITVTAARTFTASDPTGVWDVYPTYQDASGGWHDGTDATLSVGVSGFSISSALALSASSASTGQTITGTVTYTNGTASPVTIDAVTIAARPPGGSHAGGPYDDFSPSAQQTTVAPGASVTVTASRTFAATDPAGTWDVYPTYEDANGTWHDGPDESLNVTAPPPPSSNAFSVQNGQIIAPDGSAFVARGINVYDSSQGSVSTNAAGQPLTTLFPGINFIRLATYQYSGPSYFQTFVQQMSALHVVVEIEHHEGAGGGVAPLTGQDLTDESNWFATLAGAFKDDPYVWFGTLNEPSGPGSDLTAEQVSNYQAIRGAGNGSPIMMEVLGDYSTGSLTVGAGHGLIASSYANMHNIVWDFHYYNWLSNYSADVGTNANLLASYIAQSQTIPSGDGTVPVIIGEYGISTDGTNVDPGGNATCVAVQQSGVGSSAWNWDSYAASDNLTDGNGNLTPYGQEVASYINGR